MFVQEKNKLRKSKQDRRKTMFPAGLKPATFHVWGVRDNHYTTETSVEKTLKKLLVNYANVVL